MGLPTHRYDYLVARYEIYLAMNASLGLQPHHTYKLVILRGKDQTNQKIFCTFPFLFYFFFVSAVAVIHSSVLLSEGGVAGGSVPPDPVCIFFVKSSLM